MGGQLGIDDSQQLGAQRVLFEQMTKERPDAAQRLSVAIVEDDYLLR